MDRNPSAVPVSLIIDDSCPLVHVYAAHRRDVHGRPLATGDGREIPLWIPNDFLRRFCDVAERWGMAGKFSIVPAPGGLGDVVRGIEGHDPSLTREWLDVVRRRLSARWDFCPEGITHNLAVDLDTRTQLPESENAWSQHQDRSTLVPYLVRQFELLRDAGIDATGVTSPWVFGIKVEGEYIASIIEAQRRVFGRRFSWYFLHAPLERPETRPWIAFQDETATLVHIPALVNDVFWQTMESPRTDPAYVREIADRCLTEDGCHGRIREVLDAGGWPVLVTHWQSLFSNGLETGLMALEEVGRRVHRTLRGEVEWLNMSELAQRIASPSLASLSLASPSVA